MSYGTQAAIFSPWSDVDVPTHSTDSFLVFVGSVLLFVSCLCLLLVLSRFLFWPCFLVTFSGSSARHRSDYLVTLLLGCEALTCVTASSA